MSQLINHQIVQELEVGKFQNTLPFPWVNLHEFLTREAFKALYQNFPSLDLFEQHMGIERAHGQRAHNRYYLAYESSIYHDGDSKGTVKKSQLPDVWQQFLTELEGPQYRQFIQQALGVSHYKVRYAWHVGFSGCEVSPHIDSSDKIGTHIFYFNTSQDWDPDWGGAILVLDDKRTETLNPDYSDFGQITAANVLDNRSFLFKNAPQAWHGVQPLNCPEQSYRRLFNVIFEYPEARTWLKSPIAQVGRKLLPFKPLRDAARSLIVR